MKHGSLFSGIGGFDLAAEWMGWENVFHCEWNSFGQKVLKHYWSKAISYEDITKTDFTIHRGNIDILTGGFPCQPYSAAGKRLGKEDERHLWPQMLRAIREIKPRWVVGENVYGLVNWSGGLVFHEVQADLEAEGYEVQPYLLPAVSVNAPHRRDRIWFVAYANKHTKRPPRKSGSIEVNGSEGYLQQKQWREKTEFNIGLHELSSNAADPNSNGQHISHSQHEINPSEGRVDAQRNSEQSNGDGDAADTMQVRLQQCEDGREMGGGQSKVCGAGSESANGTEANGEVRNVADTCNEGLERSKDGGSIAGIGKKSHKFTSRCIRSKWEKFPSVSPIRMRDDGVSNKLLRFVVNEFYDTISYTSQKNRIKNLQEVWETIQSEEIWEKIRRLYTLESKIVLLQTMQLYSSEWDKQGKLSSFSKEFCKPVLQHLSKYGEFRCSPQGQELEKQRNIQFGDSLSFLPHEVALAARRFETAITKFEAWHRNESIKAGGNAIVPQVVYQIFKTIEQYEILNNVHNPAH